MGGAQGLGITLNGGRALIVEVDPARAERRAAAGWVDHVTADYREAVAALDDPHGPPAIGLVGNIAEIAPRLLADGVGFDIVTDQTAAHDLLHGYVPIGRSAEDAGERPSDDRAYLDAARASLARHVEALLGFRARGAVAFEYGNNLRAQARDAGVDAAGEIPGFIDAYVRGMLATGIGPYRWIALTGDPADLERSEDVALRGCREPLAPALDRARTRTTPTAGAPGEDLLARAG